MPAPSWSNYIPVETSTGGQTSLPPSRLPPRRHNSNKEDVQGICQKLFIVFMMLTLLVCLVRLSIDNIKKAEREPVTNPNVQLKSATFSLFNLSSSSSPIIEGEIGLNFTKPQNCTILFYDHIVVSLFHAEKPLSIAISEPFFQNESNHTMVKAIFPPTNAPHRDPKGMPNSSLTSFELSFDVNAKGRLWPNIKRREDFIEYSRQMYVRCPNLKVRILMKTGVGMMEGEPAECKVENFYG
ncbi:hypothetical protein RHSIM_Rhsim07G0169000 [Rhododendron simsii]|uniref:Late embryogenesis abundant protein LEA-2 subgroup domain-containing protein n=1 Tax=Rhododendron simsii TaxID=118357 RepID=A0A834GQR4_RHOSS|nr:hypothetical protein RHSIM_Rhsim07G0169000 [Rhododendron simsii]